MVERYDIAIKVISQQGLCRAGHKVGEEWLMKGKTPEGICLSAFHSLLPHARTMMFGGTLPWEPDPDIALVACPDARNPVVFELRRIR